jgi:cysteinyl-tRNA synthetase
MQNLFLRNTLTSEKEIFESIKPKQVSMYVCGITPYDFAHVGHGRCYVTFDVLYRLLQAIGYHVDYARNFTDIDDKLLIRSEKEYGDQSKYLEVANRFIRAYHEDMERLNCLSPNYEPRVTEVIPEIVAFIEGLIKKGKAYESNGSVYFAVDAFHDYCKLSKRNVDELRAGARVEVSDEKRNPLDFALWKAEAGDVFWQSPWGHGRPGWHIECSVMAEKFLGKIIDIHGGGMDLIFPHHENEIAQSESLHDHIFARYWIHNAFVRIDKEKMSKSLGNFFTLRQVFEKYDPMIVRFMILTHHYRSPLDFSFDDLEVAKKTYQRLCKLLNSSFEKDFVPEGASSLASDDGEGIVSTYMKNELAKKMLTFLCDDMNTPGMWGVVFENFKQLQDHEEDRKVVKAILQNILGLTLIPLPEKEVTLTPEIELLIAEREEARKKRDWSRADALRETLKNLGYEVQDKATK